LIIANQRLTHFPARTEFNFSTRRYKHTHTHTHTPGTPAYTHKLQIKPPLFFISCCFSLPVPTTLTLSMRSAVALCGAPNVYYCWCLQVCLNENHQPFTTASTTTEQPTVCKTANNMECSVLSWWRGAYRKEIVS